MVPCLTQRPGIAAAEGHVCGQPQIETAELQRVVQHILTSAAPQPASQWRFTGHTLHDHHSDFR